MRLDPKLHKAANPGDKRFLALYPTTPRTYEIYDNCTEAITALKPTGGIVYLLTYHTHYSDREHEVLPSSSRLVNVP